MSHRQQASTPIESQSFSERDDGIHNNQQQRDELSPLNPSSSPFKPIRDIPHSQDQRWAGGEGAAPGAAPISAFPVLSDAASSPTGELGDGIPVWAHQDAQQQQHGLSWMRSPSSFSSYSPFASPNPSPFTLPGPGTPGHPHGISSNNGNATVIHNNNSSMDYTAKAGMSPRTDSASAAGSYAIGYDYENNSTGTLTSSMSAPHTRDSSPRTEHEWSGERKSPLSPLYNEVNASHEQFKAMVRQQVCIKTTLPS
jgi:hypothetical protein